MFASELARRQQGTEVVVAPSEEDPFVFSPQMVTDLQLMAFARRVLWMAHWLRPGRRGLPDPRGGRPCVYHDESVLVTLLVMTVWQLSPEAVVKRMRRWPVLAAACGYTPDVVISGSQLRRRRDQLGLWVYFMTFCALVWVLISRGVVVGRDWVL